MWKREISESLIPTGIRKERDLLCCHHMLDFKQHPPGCAIDLNPLIYGGNTEMKAEDDEKTVRGKCHLASRCF